VELVWTRTHKGPLGGPGGKKVPPTNRPLRLHYVLVLKFEGGVVTELDEYFDQVEILTHLDLMP
jgi:ketosteroid isomerase-like protein